MGGGGGAPSSVGDTKDEQEEEGEEDSGLQRARRRRNERMQKNKELEGIQRRRSERGEEGNEEKQRHIVSGVSSVVNNPNSNDAGQMTAAILTEQFSSFLSSTVASVSQYYYYASSGAAQGTAGGGIGEGAAASFNNNAAASGADIAGGDATMLAAAAANVGKADFREFVATIGEAYERFRATRSALESEPLKIDVYGNSRNSASVTGDNDDNASSIVTPRIYSSGLARAIHAVPAIFFDEDFSVDRIETFNAILAFGSRSSSQDGDEEHETATSETRGAAARAERRISSTGTSTGIADAQRASDDDALLLMSLQEKFSSYIDVVETSLSLEIASQSRSLLHAADSINDFESVLCQAMSKVQALRIYVQSLRADVVDDAALLLRLQRDRENCVRVMRLAKCVETTAMAFQTMRLMLSGNDYFSILELMDEIRPVLFGPGTRTAVGGGGDGLRDDDPSLLDCFRKFRTEFKEMEVAVKTILTDELVDLSIPSPSLVPNMVATSSLSSSRSASMIGAAGGWAEMIDGGLTVFAAMLMRPGTRHESRLKQESSYDDEDNENEHERMLSFLELLGAVTNAESDERPWTGAETSSSSRDGSDDDVHYHDDVSTTKDPRNAVGKYLPLIVSSYCEIGDALFGPVTGLLTMHELKSGLLQYRKSLHRKLRSLLRMSVMQLLAEAGINVGDAGSSPRGEGERGVGEEEANPAASADVDVWSSAGAIIDANVEMAIVKLNSTSKHTALLVSLMGAVLPLLMRALAVHRFVAKCAASYEHRHISGQTSSSASAALPGGSKMDVSGVTAVVEPRGEGGRTATSNASVVKDSSDILGATMDIVNETLAQIVSVHTRAGPVRASEGGGGGGGGLGTKARPASDGAAAQEKGDGSATSGRGSVGTAIRVDDVVKIAAVASGFHPISRSFGGRSHTIKASILQLSKHCFDLHHRDNLEKLVVLLKQENWMRVARVPSAMSDIVNDLVSMAVPPTPTSLSTSSLPDGSNAQQHQCTANANGSPSVAAAKQVKAPSDAVVTDLCVHAYGNQIYRMTSSSPMLVRMLASYVNISEKFPMLATDVVTRLAELLSTYNSQTCTLILGAEAIRHSSLNEIKSITAKHIAMVIESLRLMANVVVPSLKRIMSGMLEGPRAALFLPSFDRVVKDMKVHRVECIKKLITIMMERLTFHSRTLAKCLQDECVLDAEQARRRSSQAASQTLSAEEGTSSSPRRDPSNFASSLVKELATLNRILTPLLTKEDLHEVFSYVVSNYDTNIAKLFKYNASLAQGISVNRVIRRDAVFFIERLNAVVAAIETADMSQRAMGTPEGNEDDGGTPDDKDSDASSRGPQTSATPQLDAFVATLDLQSEEASVVAPSAPPAATAGKAAGGGGGGFVEAAAMFTSKKKSFTLPAKAMSAMEAAAASVEKSSDKRASDA